MKSNHTIKIFLVEDDSFFANIVIAKLELLENIELSHFPTGKEFLDSMYLNPDIVIIDYDLPDSNGLDLLKAVKKINKNLIAIFLSGQSELNVVVEAYKENADRYIIKDQNSIVELSHNVETFIKVLNTRKELDSLRDQLIETNQYEHIIGSSPAIKTLFKLMQKVQNINIPVLVTGSNGTGKELVANALHYNSDRKRRPFVAINVAAIPEDLIENELFGSEKGAFTGASRRSGKFEEANRGTIFLDEIAEMPLGLQAKLLRVLQESKVTRLGGSKEIKLDIKVISATNKDLWKEVQEGRFREDLYFRLQGFIIRIPSLDERENDIIRLAKHFVETFCKDQKIEVKTLNASAVQSMMDYRWPGNVRELKSMVERAALISDSTQISADDLIFLEQRVA